MENTKGTLGTDLEMEKIIPFQGPSPECPRVPEK